MATSDLQSYRILLVGKTGSGKSSTGNSILDKNVFKSRKPYDSSDGDVIACHSSVVDGRYVFIVDGTGIGGTCVDLNGDVKSLLQLFDSTMKHEMYLFNAIVLVHFIHERSQVTMKSSVFEIQSIFGRSALKKWGIIVVTFGDLYDVNNLDENIHSFEDWCQQQAGYFQILLEECNHRCVLFDNKTTDNIKRMEQRNKLMSLVDSMTYKPYTRNDFVSPTCKLSRQHLILMEEVNSKFKELDGNINSQNDVSTQGLELLFTKLMEHRKNLVKQRQEPEFTKQLLNQVIETVKNLQLKTGHVFHQFEQTIAEELEYSIPILSHYEERPSSQTQLPISPPADELLTNKVKSYVSEIHDKKSTEIDASGIQESDIQSETIKRTLLLVGPKGSGKSSVGNSILCEVIFDKSFPDNKYRLKNKIACNDEFVVVDCTSIGDTTSDMQGEMRFRMQSAFDAMIINNNSQDCLNPVTSDKETSVFHRCGFDALLFVLPFGVSFNKHDKAAVRMVKSIYGDNVFRDRGVLVFSHGDKFKKFENRSNKSFDDWCKEQRGKIKSLFEEVSYRCVLFDTNETDKDKLEKLRECIKQFEKQNMIDFKLKKYFLEDFICCRRAHINERYNRLDYKTKKFIAMIKSNATRRCSKITKYFKDTLYNEWMFLGVEIDLEMKYFFLKEEEQAYREEWESKQDDKKYGESTHVVDAEDGESTLVDTIYGESTQIDTIDDESTHDDTEDGESTQVDTNYGESTQVDSNYGEPTQVDTNYGESTQVDTIDDESTQDDTEDGESTQVDAVDDESTQYDIEDDELTQYDAEDGEFTQYDAEDGELKQYDAADGELTQYDAEDGELTQLDTEDGGSIQVYPEDGESKQVDAEDGESTQDDTKEEDQSKQNKLHYVEFRCNHQCQFEINHEITFKDYTDDLKTKVSAATYNMTIIDECIKDECILI